MIRAAWRILKPRHAETAFAGDGARLYGGRWNNPGTAIVYTAGSVSLAALEMLVHLQSHQILESYSLCDVRLEETLLESVDADDLPKNWRSDPAPGELKAIGDGWVRERSSVVLRVPSAIVEAEWNYLLNPAHPRFSEIAIGSSTPFRFDPRLRK